jgi:hypothetical protein
MNLLLLQVHFLLKFLNKFTISRAWNQKLRLIIMGIFQYRSFDYILGGTFQLVSSSPKEPNYILLHSSPIYNWVRASPPMLSMWPSKNISYIQVLVINLFFDLAQPFSNWNWDQQIAGEITNSNPLRPIKLSNTIRNKVQRLDSSRAVRTFQGFQWIHWIWVMNLIQHVY